MITAFSSHGFGRIFLLVGGLFVLWLLMSGVYKPLTIGFGLASSFLCVWLISRLGLIDNNAVLQDFFIVKTARYLFWLVVEIGKADWAVAKVILSDKIPDEQQLIAVPANQRTDFGKMLFANSITITPGTVTVETEKDHFIVHALNNAAAEMDDLEAMGKRVCALERPMNGSAAP